MTHYSAGQWTDFVRGLVKPAEATQMRLHLESGCSQCMAEVQWLEQVAERAMALAESEVPEEAVSRAMAVFNGGKPKDWIERLTRVVAELVFATGPDMVPAGVRSSAAIGQRFVYSAGGYSVDLLFETSGSTRDMEVIGQISMASATPDDAEIRKIPVQAALAGKVLAETETNQFGEFALAMPVRPGVVLRFAIAQRGCRVEVPIQKSSLAGGKKRK